MNKCKKWIKPVGTKLLETEQNLTGFIILNINKYWIN